MYPPGVFLVSLCIIEIVVAHRRRISLSFYLIEQVVLRKRKWMAVNSSAVSLRKPLAGGQREKTAKSTSVPPPFAIQVTRSSLPNSYLFCSRGKNAKNVIKSTSVLCHAAWTDGLLASFTRSSIVFSCYWTRIKSGSACAFLCTNNVCLFTRPD